MPGGWCRIRRSARGERFIRRDCGPRRVSDLVRREVRNKPVPSHKSAAGVCWIANDHAGRCKVSDKAMYSFRHECALSKALTADQGQGSPTASELPANALAGRCHFSGSSKLTGIVLPSGY